MSLFEPVHLGDVQRVVGRRRNVVEAEELLGLDLVERQRARQDTGARVGDAEDFEQPLDAAVLAVGTVKGDEGDVDRRLTQHLIDVGVDVDLHGVVALADERSVNRFAGLDGNLALGADTTQQHPNALVLHRLLHSWSFAMCFPKEERDAYQVGIIE